VLALYRKSLRESRKKPEVCIDQLASQTSLPNFCRMSELTSNPSQGQSQIRIIISALEMDLVLMLRLRRKEFEKSIMLDKKDFGAIEYLLRKGQRQLEIYSSPGIKDIR